MAVPKSARIDALIRLIRLSFGRNSLVAHRLRLFHRLHRAPALVLAAQVCDFACLDVSAHSDYGDTSNGRVDSKCVEDSRNRIIVQYDTAYAS